MECRLCNVEKGKLCKAHLIPESFYRFMYPSNNVEGDALRVVLHDVDYVKKSRIGLYDDSLLCASCDQILGRLDEYGKDILLTSIPKILNTGNDIFILTNVDINKLITFFLSVLWRCSISKRPETRDVSIGAKFEGKIRRLLYQDNGSLDDFAVVISRYNYLNDNYKKMVILPTYLKMDGINFYYVYFPNGYKVLIKVDSRPQPPQLNSLTLTAGNPAYVVKAGYFEATLEYIKTSTKVKSINFR